MLMILTEKYQKKIFSDFMAIKSQEDFFDHFYLIPATAKMVFSAKKQSPLFHQN